MSQQGQLSHFAHAVVGIAGELLLSIGEQALLTGTALHSPPAAQVQARQGAGLIPHLRCGWAGAWQSPGGTPQRWRAAGGALPPAGSRGYTFVFWGSMCGAACTAGCSALPLQRLLLA